MPGQQPAGLRPFLVVVFLAGAGLIALALMRPGIHALWELPLGVVLAGMSLGKMVAR